MELPDIGLLSEVINIGMTNWAHRLEFERALHGGHVSDVTFLVGRDNPVAIPAHRTILAIFSPVFEAMFFGSLKEEDNQIAIPDLSPTGFKFLLEFMYIGDMKCTSAQEVFLTYECAEKYLVQTALEACKRRFTAMPITSLNVWTMLEVTEYLNLRDKRRSCVQFLAMHASKAFRSDDILMASLETLKKVLRLDYVNIAEQDILYAIVRWGEDSVEEGGEELSDVIRALLEMVRFKALTAQEWLEFTCKHQNAMSKEDSSAILYYLSRENIRQRHDCLREDDASREDVSRRENVRQEDVSRGRGSRRGDVRRVRGRRRGRNSVNDVSRRGSGSRDDFSRRGSGSRDDVSRRGRGSRDGVSRRGSGSRDDVSQRGSSSRNDVSRRGNGSRDDVRRRWSIEDEISRRWSGIRDDVSRRGCGSRDNVSRRGNGRRRGNASRRGNTSRRCDVRQEDVSRNEIGREDVNRRVNVSQRENVNRRGESSQREDVSRQEDATRDEVMREVVNQLASVSQEHVSRPDDASRKDLRQLPFWCCDLSPRCSRLCKDFKFAESCHSLMLWSPKPTTRFAFFTVLTHENKINSSFNLDHIELCWKYGDYIPEYFDVVVDISHFLVHRIPIRYRVTSCPINDVDVMRRWLAIDEKFAGYREGLVIKISVMLSHVCQVRPLVMSRMDVGMLRFEVSDFACVSDMIVDGVTSENQRRAVVKRAVDKTVVKIS